MEAKRKSPYRFRVLPRALYGTRIELIAQPFRAAIHPAYPLKFAGITVDAQDLSRELRMKAFQRFYFIMDS
jgi:hypothetical protein